MRVENVLGARALAAIVASTALAACSDGAPPEASVIASASDASVADALARPVAPEPPRPTGGFDDDFSRWDADRWAKGGWDPADDNYYGCTFSTTHALFPPESGGGHALKLSDQVTGKWPFTCASLYSKEKYRYGRFAARMKASNARGTCTAFFLYDKGSRDEIDFEILGKDTTRIQTAYYLGGDGYHEKWTSLGFDASVEEHEYAVEWSENRVRWLVDDKVIRTETVPLTKPQSINTMFWSGNTARANVMGWIGGPLAYPGQPIFARFSRISYQPL